MTIRVATSGDGVALAELDARSWPPEVTVVPPGRADESFFTVHRAPADVLIATDDDGLLVGYAQLARHIPIAANAHVLHINSLVVDPSRRGTGLGAALVDAAIDEARRRGVRKLGLRALSTNERALRIYRRAGFVEEGRLRDEIRLPNGDYADDVWFALDLNSP